MAAITAYNQQTYINTRGGMAFPSLGGKPGNMTEAAPQPTASTDKVHISEQAKALFETQKQRRAALEQLRYQQVDAFTASDGSMVSVSMATKDDSNESSVMRFEVTQPDGSSETIYFDGDETIGDGIPDGTDTEATEGEVPEAAAEFLARFSAEIMNGLLDPSTIMFEMMQRRSTLWKENAEKNRVKAQDDARKTQNTPTQENEPADNLPGETPSRLSTGTRTGVISYGTTHTNQQSQPSRRV